MMTAQQGTKITLSLSVCSQIARTRASVNTKPGYSPSLIYRELEKLASAKELIRAQVLVQTRAQKGDLPVVRCSGAKEEETLP